MSTHYAVVIFLFSLLLICPGLLVKKHLRNLNGLFGIVYSILISLSFWVCITWYISIVKAPLRFSLFFLLGCFLILTLVSYRKSLAELSFSRIRAFAQRQPVSRWILLIAVLLYLFPSSFMTIPPGSDISMHGYITRLILDNNGLPETYDPIIPNSYFGSYSAGYHAITALICGVSLDFMRESINLMSVAVFPVALLSLVFLYSRFVSEKTAIYAGIITFSINNSLQSTIGWGGTPTILAFAFCLFCLGSVMLAVRYSDAFIFRITAFALAAIPLVHAIPAITFIYLSVPALLLLLFFNRDQWTWILKNTLYTGTFAIILLLPFLIHFRNENSPELISLIKSWQKEMMGNQLTDDLFKNIGVVINQIKYRSGDPLVIVSLVSIAGLLFYKMYKPVVLIFAFMVYIFLLILNCNYWVIPFSEILYPERVAFFMIIVLGLPLALLIDKLFASDLKFTIKQRAFPVARILVFVLLIVGIDLYWNGYTLSILRNNRIRCNPPTMAAFNWISEHTAEDAIFKCSYSDAGMWIPAFANRATIGAHLHFIHEVEHINDLLESKPSKKYIFVTQRDFREQTPILAQIKDKKPVFTNEEIAIYY